MKSTKMKSILNYFLVAVLAVSSLTVVAAGKDTTSIAKKNAKSTLSLEEQAFYQDIESFYQENFVMPTNKSGHNTPKLEVYNLDGKLLHSQNESTAPIDLDLLPKGAQLLMTEGETRIYIVM